MEIKKVVFKFKSGYITPLESDTILGYILAMDFDNLKDVFEDFQKGKFPFLITNAFEDGYLPRPIYFTNDDKSDSKLEEDIKTEKDRKKLKKISQIPIDKDALELCFIDKDDAQQIKLKDYFIGENSFDDSKSETVVDFKNSIPRFYTGETNPYVIEDVQWNKEKFNIYVRVYDIDKWNLFYESMKTVFTTIGWGKGKSRGYGKIDRIEIKDLTIGEKETFEYIDQLKEDGKYYVLNNYKPTNEELKSLNLKESFIEYNHKNGKTLQTIPFKGQFSFIEARSVLVSDIKLVGDSYIFENGDNKSVNFGYLF